MKNNKEIKSLLLHTIVNKITSNDKLAYSKIRTTYADLIGMDSRIPILNTRLIIPNG